MQRCLKRVSPVLAFPSLHAFVPEILSPRPGDHHDPHRVVGRIQTHRALPQEHERSDIPFDQIVGPERFSDGFRDHLLGKGNVHAIDMRRLVKASYVFRESKDGRTAVLGGVAPDPFEHPQAVMERVSEYMDLGLVPIDETSIHPDLLSGHSRSGIVAHVFGTFLDIAKDRTRDTNPARNETAPPHFQRMEK